VRVRLHRARRQLTEFIHQRGVSNERA
jgi:hypothetical protein